MNNVGETLKLTGGARIGKSNATYPFATLSVDSDYLKLDISLLKNLEFQPKDIISIEPYRAIPALGQGIKINHRLPDYSPKVIFWTFQEPEAVIQQIKNIGFLENVNPIITKEDKKMLEKQQKSETPLKPLVPVALFFLCFTILIDSILLFPMKGNDFEILNRALIIIPSIILLFCLLAMTSKKIQTLILRPEREYHEIKGIIKLLITISGIILLITLLISFN